MSYVLLSFCTKLGLQLISIFCKPILGIDTRCRKQRSPALPLFAKEGQFFIACGGLALPFYIANCHVDRMGDISLFRVLLGGHIGPPLWRVLLFRVL